MDIDGTLLPASLEHWFLVFLLRTRRIYLSRILADLKALLIQWPLPNLYQLRLIYLRGHSENTLRQWIQICWKGQIQPRLFPGVVETVRWFQSVEARVVLLSGTPRPLAEPLMNWLKISDIICAEPEIQRGVYTGRLLTPYPKGSRKVAFAKAWLQGHGYEWNQVIALADNWNDRFLLARVGHPIVVSPGWRLRCYAGRHAWLIIDDVNEPYKNLWNL